MERQYRLFSLVFISLSFIGFWFMKLSAGTLFLTGVLAAIVFGRWLDLNTKALSKAVLQYAVVGIGAGLPLSILGTIETKVFFMIFGSIVCVLVLGKLMTSWLGLTGTWPVMVTIGTAICGATAIATVSPIIKPKERDLMVALGTIFTLNASALLLFPLLGESLGLTQTQFGVWSAIAIHDTSSVCGASIQYGVQALNIALLLKLVRSLGIIPVSLALIPKYARDETVSMWRHMPWFLGGFVLMSVLFSVFPEWSSVGASISHVSKYLLVFSMFLLGLQFKKDMISKECLKPLLFGIVLWVSIASVSLMGVLFLI